MDNTSENEKLASIFRLIRWENLVIIFATQYFFGKYVIDSLLYVPDQVLQKFYSDKGLSNAPFHFGLQISDLNFFLLCLSTVCIAAAGYIINDYFDVKTDRINRPSSIIIGKVIKRRVAMLLHVVLNLLGIGLGVYVAYSYGNIKLSLIHFFSATILWFYSTNFKKMFILGNLIVALLIGIVPLTVAIYNNVAMSRACAGALINDIYYLEFINLYNVDIMRPMIFAYFFSLFAFLINFQREVVKDIEDFAGDLETGGKTIPITMGYKFARSLVQVLNVLTIIISIFASIKFAQPNRDFVWYKLGVASPENINSDWISFVYFILLIAFPLVLFSFRFYRSNSPRLYKKSGILLKLVMVAGILYSFVIWYNFTKPIT